MGLETLLIAGLGIAAGVGAGVGISKLSGGKDNAPSAPQPLPQAPDIADAESKAEESVRRRRVQQSKTVYTDPLGVSGQANVVRKTLTGQ